MALEREAADIVAAVEWPVRASARSGALVAVDLVIRWGDWTLAAVHLAPPRSFYVGEQGCDFTLPAEVVGAARAPVLLARWDGVVRAVIPKGARVTLDGRGKPMTGSRGVARGHAQRSSAFKDATEVVLWPGRSVAVHLGPMTIEMTRSEEERRAPRAPWIARSLLLSHLAALAVHAGLGAFLAAMEPAAIDEDIGISDDQRYELQQRLTDIAEKEMEGAYDEFLAGIERRARRRRDRATAREEDERTQALWAAGEIWANQLRAEALREEARHAGNDRDLSLVGLFYERPESKPTTVTGAVFLPREKYDGPTSSTLAAEPARHGKGPQVRMGAVSISGRLPPKVIGRIVRQNFGRFRLCYENGLRNNPSLQGRVAVHFVIGNDGAVSNVGNAGSDMPDSSVVSCVVRAFYGLSFPRPERGIVTVMYPIMFSPPG
jgi:hypothetical protein